MSDDYIFPTGTTNKIISPLVLHAEGFTLKLTPLAPYRDLSCHKIFFNGTVSVETEGSAQPYCIETFMECYLSDLERLREEIEAHVQRLMQHRLVDRDDRASEEKYIDSILTGPSLDGLTWVPLELELQITCLDGDVWYERNELAGSFSMRIMVHVPSRPEVERSRIYVGCEGSVDIQEVQLFCAALRCCVGYYEKL